MEALTPFPWRPVTVAYPFPLREQAVTAQGKTCFAVSNSSSHKELGMNAVGSVASLEWIWRIDEYDPMSQAQTNRLIAS